MYLQANLPLNQLTHKSWLKEAMQQNNTLKDLGSQLEQQNK